MSTKDIDTIPMQLLDILCWSANTFVRQKTNQKAITALKCIVKNNLFIT